MSAAIKSEKPSLGAAARKALADCDGDVRAATRLLIERARADDDLFVALLDPLLERAAYAEVTAACRKDRGIVWNMPQPTGDESRSRIVALATGTVSSLLDFPLPGGKRLRDATRSEVAEAADFYRKQATDMGQKARWMQLVAQSIPDGSVVGEVMTAERLEQLKSEATR